ncbi:MAG: hypothetical protein M0036_00130 [Desulfobacteraceae bacterium]|nr:hypothetical protein [Desulfobacteraceae bacterium]
MDQDRNTTQNTTLPVWTVIGYYPGTNQRFATTVLAPCADVAEHTVLSIKHDAPIAVCGIVRGDHCCEDTADNVVFQDEQACVMVDEDEF